MLARKFGPPVKVLEALYQFDSVASIESAPQKARAYDSMKQQLDGATKKIGELEGQVAEIPQLRGQISELDGKLENSAKTWIRNIEDTFLQLRSPVGERKFPRELAGSDVPDLLEKILEKEVSDRLTIAENRPLQVRFADEIEQELQRLEKNWPTRELGKLTQETIRLLRQLRTENPFAALKGRWLIKHTFDGCEHTFDLKSTRDVRELLVKDEVTINAACLHRSESPYHEFRVSLRDVVHAYICEEVRRLRQQRLGLGSAL